MNNINYKIPLLIALGLIILGGIFRFLVDNEGLAAIGMILIGLGGFTYLFSIYLRNKKLRK